MEVDVIRSIIPIEGFYLVFIVDEFLRNRTLKIHVLCTIGRFNVSLGDHQNKSET